MAIPDTLASWREFVTTTPARPTLLNSSELRGLSAEEKAAYDRNRLDWIVSDVVFETPDVSRLARVTTVLRAESSGARITSPRTLAVSGPAASGKTTAALQIAREHERRVRASRDAYGPDLQPSLYVVVPPATTPKMLMVAFCNCLGLPYARRQSAQELTEMVVHVIRELGTSLIVLDEVHNVQSNRQSGAEAASTLKLFAERVDSGFLFAGIDLLRSAAFAGDFGAQLAARSTVYEMKGFTLRTEAGRAEWHDLLSTLAALTVLSHSPEDMLLRNSSLIFDMTRGSVGATRALIRRAAIDAILTGKERLTREGLSMFLNPIGSLTAETPPSQPRRKAG